METADTERIRGMCSSMHWPGRAGQRAGRFPALHPHPPPPPTAATTAQARLDAAESGLPLLAGATEAATEAAAEAVEAAGAGTGAGVEEDWAVGDAPQQQQQQQQQQGGGAAGGADRTEL